MPATATTVEIQTLRQLENQVDPKIMREEQPARATWLPTVKSIHTIHTEKLYKATHGSIEAYAINRWKCSKQWFYQYSRAGGVVKELERNGCELEDLLNNTGLCEAILKLSKKLDMGVSMIWTPIFYSVERKWPSALIEFWEGVDDLDNEEDEEDEKDEKRQVAVGKALVEKSCGCCVKPGCNIHK
ncbi:hypothetical protein HDV00_009683 [Rhizophlyctis rosea]|nr:hypothetical protein HDV00_009683 [Rhizophlyctis rosea]